MIPRVTERSSSGDAIVRPWIEAALGLALMAAGVSAFTSLSSPQERAERQVLSDFRAYERLAQQVVGAGQCADPTALVSQETLAAFRHVLTDIDIPSHFSNRRRYGYQFVFFGEHPARDRIKSEGEPEVLLDCTWVAAPVDPRAGWPTFTYFSFRPGLVYLRKDGLRATGEEPARRLSEAPF